MSFHLRSILANFYSKFFSHFSLTLREFLARVTTILKVFHNLLFLRINWVHFQTICERKTRAFLSFFWRSVLANFHSKFLFSLYLNASRVTLARIHDIQTFSRFDLLAEYLSLFWENWRNENQCVFKFLFKIKFSQFFFKIPLLNLILRFASFSRAYPRYSNFFTLCSFCEITEFIFSQSAKKKTRAFLSFHLRLMLANFYSKFFSHFTLTLREFLARTTTILKVFHTLLFLRTNRVHFQTICEKKTSAFLSFFLRSSLANFSLKLLFSLYLNASRVFLARIHDT